MMRIAFRLLSLVCCIGITAFLFSVFSVAEAVQATPSVSAQSAILIDAENQTILFQKDCHRQLPMASTTKIMTALVALDCAPLDTVITVDPQAVGVEGSSIYLTAGEQLTLEHLLYALLLESANDAATAIAIGLSGSVEEFALKMTEKANELGLEHTKFQNPHGLDAQEHHTTAYDLAIITAEALKNPTFQAIVSTRKTTIPHAGIDGVRLLVNHNKLLRSYDGAIGVKTGFTKKSGRCLVSAAQRSGATLVAVTLNAPDDWQDHTSLLDYGFSMMERITLCDAHEICIPVSVVGSNVKAVFVSNTDSLSVSLPVHRSEIIKTVELPRFLYASVEAGESVGRLVYRCDLNQDGAMEIVGVAPLIAQSAAPRSTVKKSFWAWILSLFGK